jgi:hypothetical protein
MFRMLLIIMLVFIVSFSMSAQQRGERGHGGDGRDSWGHGHDDRHGWGWHGEAYPRHCGSYGAAWFWTNFGLEVGALVIGAYVAAIPPVNTVYFYNGIPYYYCDGLYFIKTPAGYMVAQPPIVIQQPVVIQQTPQVIVQPQPPIYVK